MLKIRLMGTKRDISWFQRIIQRCPSIEVTELSDIYENKGTDRFFRNYMEVQRRKKQKI